MIQQQEIGLKNRIFKNTMPQKQKCNSIHLNAIHFDSISMKEVYPALLFLGCGVCISLMLFTLEHIFKTGTTTPKNTEKLIM